MKLKIRSLIQTRSRGRHAIVVDMDRDTVELIHHKKATELTFGGLGCVGIDIEACAASFDKLCAGEADRDVYDTVDVCRVSGFSATGVCRLVQAGAIESSIRGPGRTNQDRARQYNRIDLFVAAVIGSLRRKNVGTPHLVRVGEFLRRLLEDNGTESPGGIAHEQSQLVTAGQGGN